MYIARLKMNIDSFKNASIQFADCDEKFNTAFPTFGTNGLWVHGLSNDCWVKLTGWQPLALLHFLYHFASMQPDPLGWGWLLTLLLCRAAQADHFCNQVIF